MKLRACILLLFYCLNSFLHAQDSHILHASFWDVEDGLSHRDVQCIHQDQNGFMWFGTRYGLNRFDGYQFLWITAEQNNLQANEINHILKDGEGRLWLMHTGGYNIHSVTSIDILDPTSMKVKTFEETFSANIPFQPLDIIAFSESGDDELLFLTRDNEVFSYTTYFKKLPVQINDKGARGKITRVSQGNIWIEKRESKNQLQLYVFDKDGKQLLSVSQSKIGYIEKESGVESLFLDKENLELPVDIYSLDVLGNAAYNVEKSKLLQQLPSSVLAATIELRQQREHYWLKSDIGDFCILDKGGKLFKNLITEHPELKYCTAIFFDNRDAVWASTQFGVFRFRLKETLFKQYLTDRINWRGDFYSARNLLVDQNNHLWAVVENNIGLVRVDLATEKDSIILPTPEYSKAVCTTSDGLILFKSKDSLIYLDPLRLEVVRKRQLVDENGDYYTTWSIFEDRRQTVWVSNHESSGIHLVEKDTIRRFAGWDQAKEKIKIYQMLEIGKDSIWCVTTNGLYLIDALGERILAHYWRKGEGNKKLPYDQVYDIHPDNDGSFWLGTAGNGLIRWTPEDGLIERYTRADGLPNNTIYAVYESEEGFLWLSTDNGITRFDKKQKFIKGYSEQDGLSHHEFNRVSHYQDKRGNIFFGSLNGITMFNPAELINDTSLEQALLVITSFQQFEGNTDKLVDKTSEVSNNKKIVINPSDRFFRLEFSLLTYEDIDNVQYAYIFEGVDKDWTYQKENTLRLSRLPYGQHRLRIKGQTSNGLWSDNHLLIDVCVNRPIYLQPLFIALFVVLIAVLAILFFTNRTRQLHKRQAILEETVAKRTATIRQQAEELKSLEKLKSRFFANVSHELRTPLSLMLGPIDSLIKRGGVDKTDRKLLSFVQRNGRQLQKLVNEILDLSKLENDKLEIEEEVVHLHTYLQEQLAQFRSFAQSNKLGFKLKYKVDKSLTIMFDKGKFEKIIHNFLSNALKFTPAEGNVELTVTSVDDDLIFKVKDSGKGVHPDDLPHIFDRFYQSKQADAKTEGGTGIGLSLCKELAELLSGKVWAESELGKGSIFYVRLPVKRAPVTQIEKSQQDEAVQLSPPLPIGNEKSTSLQPADFAKDMKILVVEDNIDLREYLTYLLADMHVITADNGQVAWDILCESATENGSSTPKPDMIISDLMMPVMDGMELLSKVKEDDRFRHLPFIMLTAKVNVLTKLTALRIGVDDYLNKPFREDELIARITTMLKNYQARIEFFQTEKKRVQGSDIMNENEPPKVSKIDNEWLESVEQLYLKYLANQILTLDFAASKMSLSTRQFRRKLKQFTGLSPQQYLQEMRLQKAHEHLLDGDFITIKEVAHAVGFKDTRYFSTLFKKRFGILPSEVKV